MSVMRFAALAALGALFAPVELSAQRAPLPGTGIGRGAPGRPVPLPPQAEPIARNLAYKRMRLSVESYPLISYVRSPLAAGGPTSDWTSFGAGTRADYRVTRNLSFTLDMTSSFAGGPLDVATIELGTRLGRERADRTVYSFVDLRLGYLQAQSSFDAIGGFGFPTTEGTNVFQYSDGFGALAGVGMEYALTRRFSLTAGASLMQNWMTAHDFIGSQPSTRSYGLTLYRVMLGLRFNPVRMLVQSRSER